MRDAGKDTGRELREHLLPEERILWSGQPAPGVHFTTADIFLVPFSLFWGGFAIFWEISALKSIPSGAPGAVNVIFPLFGIPFVLMGLYLIFGRFIFKAWKKRRTYYAVTDRRVISLIRVFGDHFMEADVKSISSISRRMRSSGVGSIAFGGSGASSAWSSMFANAEFGMPGYMPSQLAFVDIENAEPVYKLIMGLKQAP